MTYIDNSIFNSQTAFDVFEGANIGIAIHQMIFDENNMAIDYKFVRVNPEYARILKFKKEELEGKKALEILPILDKSLLNAYEEIVKSGESQHIQKFSDRLQIYLDIRAFSPGPGILVSFIDDVTNKTLSQLAIRKSEEKFRTLHDNMTQGIVYQNTNGEIISANSSAEEILGLSLDQMQGRKSIDPRWEAIHLDGSPFPGETHPAMMTIKTGKTYKNIVMGVFRPATQDTVWINITSVPLFKEDENIPFQVFTTFDDITGRIEAEKALRKSEKAKNLAIEDSKIKSNFLANMSHEIRTPLNGIVGMIDLMSKSHDFEKVQKDQIEIIKKSSLVLLDILNDILDLSKLEAGQFQIHKRPAQINSIINQVENLFSAQVKNQNIEWESSLDNELEDYLLIDDSKITQVISNLVGNAVKFTKEGSIAIHSSLIAKTKEDIEFKVEIKDTGAGISDHDQQEIFKEFKQAEGDPVSNQKGTGLGLTICKNLIELMGGEIGVYSELGQGSTFWFSLKAKIVEKEHSPQAKPSNKDPENQKTEYNLKVLLADDNEVNIKVAEFMLSQMKCEIIAAYNGQEAIDLVADHDFDLILMDIQMPVMDGVEATQKLREKYSKLPPIIGLSANAMEGDAERFINLGLDDYLSKPITINTLREKLKQWFPD
tara:strand:+ start:3199 stop:5169 length:1971 start_codon:yes stop_codon:yes gene_type:complete